MALWLITVALCFSTDLQPRGKGWMFFPLNAAVEMCRVVSKPAKRQKIQHSGDLEMKKMRDLLYMQNTDLQQP